MSPCPVLFVLQSGFAVLQFVPLVLPVKESPLWCNAEKLPLVYSWLQMSKVASSTSRGGKFSEKDHWDIEMNFCQQWTQPFSAAHLALFYQYCTLSVCVHRLGWDMQGMAGEGHGKSIFKYHEYLIIQYERWESFTGCNSQKRAIPWVNWHFWAHLSLAMEKPEVWASLSEPAETVQSDPSSFQIGRITAWFGLQETFKII